MSQTASKPRKQMPPEQRRESVLAAARKVFIEQGYGGASMRTIANEAGVREAMLYRICPSKKELFEEAVAGPLEEAVNKSVSQSLVLSGADPGVDEMRDLAKQFFVSLMHALREIAPLLNAVLLTDRDTATSFLKERFEPSLQEMIGVVERNREFWPHRDFDADLIIRAIYGMCWFLAIDERFRRGEESDLEYQANQLVDMVFEGLVRHDVKNQ